MLRHEPETLSKLLHLRLKCIRHAALLVLASELHVLHLLDDLVVVAVLVVHAESARHLLVLLVHHLLEHVELIHEVDLLLVVVQELHHIGTAALRLLAACALAHANYLLLAHLALVLFLEIGSEHLEVLVGLLEL